MNVGEEIVAVYLQFIRGCEFTQTNLYHPDVQGEIDVVGINLTPNELYVCEVAIHLETGLKYVKKNNQPDNVDRLVSKFSKDIKYANQYFPDYEKHFMFWSPIVKNTPTAKHDQMKDIKEIQAKIKEQYSIEIDMVINERFLSCIKELRNYAGKQTKELKSPILRLMQIEEYSVKTYGNER
jgi:hypothetical protein